MFKRISVFAIAISIGAVSLFAQGAQLRALTAGQKYKIKGVVISKENDTTFVIRDTVGVDTKVVISGNASVKNNSLFGGDKYPVSAIVRGLNLEAEGVGDSSGSLAATKVRFDKSNLATARAKCSACIRTNRRINGDLECR